MVVLSMKIKLNHNTFKKKYLIDNERVRAPEKYLYDF